MNKQPEINSYKKSNLLNRRLELINNCRYLNKHSLLRLARTSSKYRLLVSDLYFLNSHLHKTLVKQLHLAVPFQVNIAKRKIVGVRIEKSDHFLRNPFRPRSTAILIDFSLHHMAKMVTLYFQRDHAIFSGVFLKYKELSNIFFFFNITLDRFVQKNPRDTITSRSDKLNFPSKVYL